MFTLEHLDIMLKNPHEPRVILEEPIKISNYPEQAVMLSFFPDFEDQEVSTEIIFLIDR